VADPVVIETGPLIALSLLDALEWPSKLADAPVVPASIERRCLELRDPPGLAHLDQEFELGRLRREPARASPPEQPALAVLDEDEGAALALALSMGATLLTDDARLGEVARRLGRRVVGTPGILLGAHRAGLTGPLAPLFARLQDRGYPLPASHIRAALAWAANSGPPR
jgi:predicted nucleic acid-binding protein